MFLHSFPAFLVAAPQLTCCNHILSRRITRFSCWTMWVWPPTSTAVLWRCTRTAPTAPGCKACWDRCASILVLMMMCTTVLMMSFPARSTSQLLLSLPGSPAQPAVLPSCISGGHTRFAGSCARCCRWAWPAWWT